VEKDEISFYWTLEEKLVA